MSTEQALIGLLIALIIWVAALWLHSFKTADRKITAIFNAHEADMREQRLKDLLYTLNLYIGYHTWTQLTNEQKELLADVLDEEYAKQDREDGYVGTDMAHQPVERWWR